MLAITTFLFFTGLVAYISWIKTRHDDHHSSTGYFLAGRSLSWIVVAGSLLLTNLSTEQLVGLNGNGYQHGMIVMAWEIWAALAMVLMALVFLPRYLKGGISTVPQFLERRYGTTVRNITSVLFLLSLLTNLLPFVLYSGAVAMDGLFGVSKTLGWKPSQFMSTPPEEGEPQLIITEVHASPDLLTDAEQVQFGDDRTERFEYIKLANRTTTPLDLSGMSFTSGIEFDFNEASTQTIAPDQSVVLVGDPAAYTSRFGSDANVIGTFSGELSDYGEAITIERGDEVILSRTYKNIHMKGLWLFVISIGVVGGIYAIYGGLKAVAVSDTINGIGLLIGGMMIPILGLIHLGDGSFMQGIKTITENHPHMLNSIGKPESNIPFSTLFTGMILINTYYWCTNQAIVQRTFAARSLEQGQKGVLFAAAMKLLGPFYLVLPGILAFHLFGDAILETPDEAYPSLVKEVLPAPLLGFFGAVIFGAVLSSFNSGLNSATTLFSVDLYKGVFRKEASEADMVRVGKVFGTLIGIASIAVAPLIAYAQGGLFDLMKDLAALYNIPLLAIIVVGMFSKRIPALAAIVALIFGFAFYGYFGFYMDDTLFGIKMHWLHIAGINFAIIILLMIVIGRIKPAEHAYEAVYTKEVSIEPWKLAKPVSVIIVVLVALIYGFLSRF